MTKVSILASASPTRSNRPKLDSNLVQKRSQLSTQVGGVGLNSMGSNQPRAGLVRKDRAYVTLALPLEKVEAWSWK